jgi:DNA-binding beta-propeller fold protein YncE
MTTNTHTEKSAAWLDQPLFAKFTLNWETVLFTLLLIAAITTRFYLLEPRVMSHDENSHVYYSWLLYRGNGYSHDPVTHGPFQFHIVALSYFLFGDSDTTARIPAVLFSIATIAFMWNYRRYLGRAGALIAGLMLLISPYMLYYGRYVRNESFVAFWGVMMLWAALRYLETGQSRYSILLTAANVLHFATKETSYIYAAQMLLFLGLLFVVRVIRREWYDQSARRSFITALIAAGVFGGLGFGLRMLDQSMGAQAQAGAETIPTMSGALPVDMGIPNALPMAMFAGVGLALLAAIYFLVSGLSEEGDAKSSTEFGFALLATLGLFGLVFLYAKAGLPALEAAFTPPPSAAPLDVVPPVATATIDYRLQAITLVLPSILAGLGLFFSGRALMNLPRRIFPPQEGDRSFDLLVITGSLVLPALAAFFIGLYANPTDYTTAGMIRSAVGLLPFVGLAVGVGFGWHAQLWVAHAATFYTIFVVLYTTLFTNGAGFFTGIIGSLGYWLEQQGVNRGSQPWYFYVGLQVPFYEFLPAIGSLTALILLLAAKKAAIHYQRAIASTLLPAQEKSETASHSEEMARPENHNSHFETLLPPALFGFWAVTSALAYTIAGEKMPWLTVHITLPLILFAAWGLGYLVQTTDWAAFRQGRGWLALGVLVISLLSLLGVVGTLLSTNPPFRGQELAQLQSTSTFLTSLVVLGASVWVLAMMFRTWKSEQITRMVSLIAFALLAFLTARSAFMASYVNYDRATEYLVYAHCATGVKEALAQIEDISRRLTGTLEIDVAFDDETTYPYWWYLRNYPNQHFFGANPTRELRDYPVILAGDKNFAKVEAAIGPMYYTFDYVRIWWPDQDYFNFTWERLWGAISNPAMRSAIFKIWTYRDYRDYAALVGKDMSIKNWTPSGRMRLYVRKDIAAQIWNYGASPVSEIDLDPYKDKQAPLSPDQILGMWGSEPGQFNQPHGIAIGPDGSLYIADTGNHRIQRLAPDGTIIGSWGTKSPDGPDPLSPPIGPEGTFREPWGVAIGPTGSVFVADTWNHRIQKFTADGQFITSWGAGIKQDLEDPYGFYGPRGIAVDGEGRVYITDTGNKRVIVFDGDGNFITQFGSAGFEPGQFDEPVGIAVDAEGAAYVADTWNQRIQILTPAGPGNYTPFLNWEVFAWNGKSMTNYPYIAVNAQGHIFVTDPDSLRILEFTSDGKIVRFWGDGSADESILNLPTGLAFDEEGGLWVTDSGNNRVIHYTFPSQ